MKRHRSTARHGARALFALATTLTCTLPLLAQAAPPAPGANPHDHARNAVVGKLAGPAIVVGFFSKHHVGVFTHMGHTVHAHVIDPRSGIGGHADELAVRAGSVLRLPR